MAHGTGNACMGTRQRETGSGVVEFDCQPVIHRMAFGTVRWISLCYMIRGSGVLRLVTGDALAWYFIKTTCHMAFRTDNGMSSRKRESSVINSHRIPVDGTHRMTFSTVGRIALLNMIGGAGA